MTELDKAKDALMDLGWSEYESKTYSTLVQLGVATASKIAKNSNVPPNRVYQILGRLAERGFVHVVEAVGATTKFEAKDPLLVLNETKTKILDKIEIAINALDELKERKQDTDTPILYTIHGKQELSSYLLNSLNSAKESIFIGIDTLIELQHRGLIEKINELSNEITIRVITTLRGINDKYEKEVANKLNKNVELKVSKDEFSTIFMIVDSQIMIYTSFGFKNEGSQDLDYYGIYTNDKKTVKLISKSFDIMYEEGEFYIN